MKVVSTMQLSVHGGLFMRMRLDERGTAIARTLAPKFNVISSAMTTSTRYPKIIIHRLGEMPASRDSAAILKSRIIGLVGVLLLAMVIAWS